MRLSPLVCLALALTPAAAHADAVTDALGEEYTAASPAEKLVMLSVAATDKVLERRDARSAVDAVTAEHTRTGSTPEERLRLLGDLRKTAEEKLDAVNDERKEAGSRRAGFLEPDRDLQQALALDYVAAAAGPAPELDALACLELVREATNWTAHHHFVLAYVTEALQRDGAYAEADHAGKLSIIKRISEDQQMMGNQERKYVEEAVVADWMSKLLREGESPEAILEQLADFKKRSMVCFFTYSWADGLLEQLAAQRAAGGGQAAEGE